MKMTWMTVGLRDDTYEMVAGLLLRH